MSNEETKPQTFHPARELAQNSQIRNMCEYQDLQARAEEDYEGFWAGLAQVVIK